MDDAHIENQAAHLAEKDSATPPHKRSKPDREAATEHFRTEGGLENDRATQSCVFLASQDDAPGERYTGRSIAFSQHAFQEPETHEEHCCQESFSFSGSRSGCVETNCAVEECPTENCEQPSPGLFVMVEEQDGPSPHTTPQKLESSNQECLCERGRPYQCHHQSHAGGTSEAGDVLNCVKNETPSADKLAVQRNSLDYIPMPYMPSCAAEDGMNSSETFVEGEEREFKKEDNKPRLETDAEEDADTGDVGTRVWIDGRGSSESFAADVAQCADDSLPDDVTSDGNSGNNDGGSHADLEPGLPGGAAQEHAFFFRTAAAQTSFACAEHATGRGLGSVSPEPPDVIDVAAVIESHICREADRMRVEQMKRITSGCRSPTVAFRSVAAAAAAAVEGARSDGLARCSPRGTDTRGDVKPVHEAPEECLGGNRDKIPEESIRLAPSNEVIPVIGRIYKLDALPLPETSACTDGEFLHSPQGDMTVEPADSEKEFTCETGTESRWIGLNVNMQPGPEPTKQQCRAGGELDRHEHKRFHYEDRHCRDVSCTSASTNYCAKRPKEVSASDIAHHSCEVRYLESPAPSNGCHHARPVDAISPNRENTVANTQADERESCAIVDLPVVSAKAESEVEERGGSVTAGWGDATAENIVCGGERGPPWGLSPQTSLTHGHDLESDATHCTAISAKLPGDAIVPETDAGHRAGASEACAETKTQLRVHWDCSTAVFDSFEKIPLSPSADSLEHGMLFNNSPRNPIRGRPQFYYDVDGPLNEIIPMQIRHQPSSEMNERNKQLSESECNAERSPSQRVSVPSCGSHALNFGQGGSHGESQSIANLCGVGEEKQIPDAYFSQCPPATELEQSEPLAAAFNASSQFCLFPESAVHAFEQDRLGTCPQPAGLRPQPSAVATESSQNNGTPQFEMKEKFDLVLEELSLFFSIGKGAERASGSETLYAREVLPAEGTAERAVGRLSSPAAESRGRMKAEQYVQSDVRAVRQQPETAGSKVGFDCEQEVPLGLSHSSAEGEDSMYFAAKQKECTVTDDGAKQWFPAFMVLPFLNEQHRGFLEPARRLEPLKTCARPIRVGLSKRARPKQLHPYFK